MNLFKRLYWKWRAWEAVRRYDAICEENARCREIVERGSRR